MYLFLVVLIAANVIAVILESVSSINYLFEKQFYYFEIFSVMVFTIEYLLRVWSCTENEKFHKFLTGRVRFIFSPLAIIDLIAILPFYLPIFVAIDLRFLRALRLLRVFRVLKIGRYSNAFIILGAVFKRKKEELLLTVFMVIILLIIASSVMYYLEHETQPIVFSSIPEAMWWGMITLTTVGYGDVYPLTPMGKFVGMIIALLGIGLFALPAGILGSGFVEEIGNKKGTQEKCPHCGKPMDDD